MEERGLSFIKGLATVDFHHFELVAVEEFVVLAPAFGTFAMGGGCGVFLPAIATPGNGMDVIDFELAIGQSGILDGGGPAFQKEAWDDPGGLTDFQRDAGDLGEVFLVHEVFQGGDQFGGETKFVHISPF